MAARRFGRAPASPPAQGTSSGPPHRKLSAASSKDEEEDWIYYDDSVQLSDFWQELVDKRRDEDPVDLWLRLFERPDYYVEKFKEYWRIVVPKVLAPSPGKTSLDQKWDEERIQRALFDPLEAFIAGGRDKINDMYEAICSNDTPPYLCGRVFQIGDPMFSCRDCVQDSTCVMCSECFQHSAHVKHRYWMSTTQVSGGYCDCGDSEAFLRHPICTKHEAMNVTKATSSEVLQRFPMDVRARAKDLIFEICKYCLYVACHRKKFDELIVSKKEKDTWEDLKKCFQLNTYCLLLINDDCHTYNEVIQVLKSSLERKISTKEASEIADYVDKKGRATILVGPYKDCANTRDKIKSRCRSMDLEVPLKMKILPLYIVAHQHFSVRLLKWLTLLFSKCSGFRALFANVFFCTEEAKKVELPESRGNQTRKFFIGEKVLTSDLDFWKDLRKAWYSVIIEGIMKEYNSKLELSRVFVDNYNTIMTNFVADDQETDVAIVNLTVQFMTVKSIAHYLLQESAVFKMLVDMFATRLIDHIKELEPNHRNRDDFQNGMDLSLSVLMLEEKAEYSRFENILTDLMYLLRVPFDPSKYNHKIRKRFSEGVESFIHLISYLQYADPQKRQTGHHVEYETSEWEYMGKMTASLASIAHMIHKWCCRDREILEDVTNATVRAILSDQGPLHQVKLSVGSLVKEYSITHKDILTRKVSVNIPYQRFLSGLLPSFSAFGSDFAETLSARLQSHGDVYHLVDPVITALSTISSIGAGMWRLNGTPAAGQAFLYHHFYLCPSLKRHDLIMMQSAICTIDDPGRIVMALLDRFQLVPWATREVEKCEKEYKDEDALHKKMVMAETFLHIIVAIIMERHVHNIGKITEKEELTHRIIQLLCSEAMTHSKVIGALEVVEEEVPAIDELLKRVAELKPVARELGKKVYEVKKEFLSQFNPFYYYYTPETASKALDRQLEMKKKAKERMLIPPPELPPLHVAFEALTMVTSTLPVLKVILSTLERCCQDGIGTKFVTPKIVKLVCFLIIQGCQDDITSNRSTFTRHVEEFRFVEKLKQMAVSNHEDLKTDYIHELILYTKERCNDARELLLNISTKDDREPSPSRKTNNDQEDSQTSMRKAAAANRRQKIMAQMSQLQSKFAQEHAQDLRKVDLDSTPTPLSSSSSSVGFFSDQGQPVACGARRTQSTIEDPAKFYTCILCQEEQCLMPESSTDVIIVAAHIQSSTVLCQNKNMSLTSKSKVKDEYLPLTLDCGPAVTSCGHAMHAKCYHNFTDNLLKKERNRMMRQIMNFDVSKNEYLCPICNRLSNGALPLMPAVSHILSLTNGGPQSFYSWLEKVKRVVANKTIQESKAAATAKDSTVTSVLPRLVPKKLGLAEQKFKQPKFANSLPSASVDMAGTFALNMLEKCLNCGVVSSDFRLLQLSFQSCSLALHLSQLNEYDKPLLEGMNARDQDLLRFLVRLCFLYPLSDAEVLPDSKKSDISKVMIKYLKANALYLLSVLLMDDQSKCFMNLDMLNVLVMLTVALPTLLYPDEEKTFTLGRDDNFIVQLCFVAHLLQVLAGFQPLSAEEQEKLPPCPYSDNQAIERLWKQVSTYTGQSNFNVPENLGAQVKHKLLRFLRCATIFFHFYTDVPLPKATYEDMCRYLGIHNNLRDLLMVLGMPDFIDRLLQSGKMQRTIAVDFPLKPRTLIELPHEYHQLIDMAAQYKCPNSLNGENKNPALCLVCGTIVCSQSMCCEGIVNGFKSGGCTVHASKCGASKGIFIRLRKCETVIISDVKRGMMLPAPYVDDYGECDQGLKRGNPLKLDEDMYRDLKSAWVSNGIPEKIARSFDEEVLIIRAEWNML